MGGDMRQESPLMAKRPSKVDWKSEGRRSAGRELRFATKPEEVVIISVGEVMREATLCCDSREV